jgi:hypothetical protein
MQEVRSPRLRDVFFEREVGIAWEIVYLMCNPNVDMAWGLVDVTTKKIQKDVKTEDFTADRFEFLFNCNDVDKMSHDDFIERYIGQGP